MLTVMVFIVMIWSKCVMVNASSTNKKRKQHKKKCRYLLSCGVWSGKTI